MRSRVSRRIVALAAGFVVVFLARDHARGQLAGPVSTLSGLEAGVIRALALNPETAPYPIATALVGGRLQLSGVVGTKHAHDSVIRTVLAFTPNIDDEIVIDTAATIPAAGAGMGPMGGGLPGAGYAARPTMGNMPYTYPPPLFGYYDDPFYGFEPPILTYPPWWNAMSAVRLGRRRALMAPPPAVPPPAMAAPQPAAPLPVAPQPVAPLGPAPAGPVPAAEEDDSFEMTIDAQGVATLKGLVKDPAERAEIERRIARMPGVAGVVNELEIAKPQDPNPGLEPVPPDPEPEPQARIPRLLDPRAARPAPAPARVQSLVERIRAAIARRPGLENAAVRVEDVDGRVSLSGQVPDVYEAMLAYRAAEQTPGVRSIFDALAFEVPQPGEPNPLIEKGTRDDVEPYLKAQIQRQTGESVHIDRISAVGDALEVQGTLSKPGDQARVEAILRSMPILRGYQIHPVFRVN